MAVARISSQEDIRTGTEDPDTIAVTVDATCKALVVGIGHGVSGTSIVSSMKLGGYAFTKIIGASDTVTEPGVAELWFLARPLTGAQTLTIDYTSASTTDVHTVVWQLSGDDDLEVIDSDSINNNAADPTVTLQAGGRDKISLAMMYGGGAAPGGTLATGNTLDHTHDHGAFYSQSCYETTVDNADHTIGWSTLASDDLAFVAIAVSEITARTVKHLGFTNFGQAVNETPNPMVINHNGGSTTKGVLVYLFQNGVTTDRVTSVTYGGVGMTRVGRAVDTAGEIEVQYVYFLGASIPTGTQEVAVNHDGGASGNLGGHVYTVTGDGDMEVYAFAEVDEDQANPQAALNTGATETLRYGILNTGHDDPPGSVVGLAGMTGMEPHWDAGTRGIAFGRQVYASSGSFTVGYTAASEDVAMVAVAVGVAATAMPPKGVYNRYPVVRAATY